MGVISPTLLCLNRGPLQFHRDIDSPYPRRSRNALHTRNSMHGDLASKLRQAVSDLEPRIGTVQYKFICLEIKIEPEDVGTG